MQHWTHDANFFTTYTHRSRNVTLSMLATKKKARLSASCGREPDVSPLRNAIDASSFLFLARDEQADSPRTPLPSRRHNDQRTTRHPNFLLAATRQIIPTHPPLQQRGGSFQRETHWAGFSNKGCVVNVPTGSKKKNATT